MKRFKPFLALCGILLFVSVLSGCNATKRASRLINKARVIAPELFEDTIVKTDVQVIIPERNALGKFPLEFYRELSVDADGVKTDVVVTPDTVYIQTYVKPDTVVKTVETKVEVIKPQIVKKEESFMDSLNKIFIGAVTLMVIYLIIKLTDK